MTREATKGVLADCLADGQRSLAAELLQRLQAQSGYPISVVLGVTERCNLSCPHCFVPRPDEERRLSVAELERVFDELMGLGVLFLTITGGEPCLREELVEVVKAARVRRFDVTLKTNGTRLSGDILRQLREVGLHRIDASLYHDEASEHDAFVGQLGAYDLVLGALDQWVALGGGAVVSFTAMNWNVDRVDGVIELADAHHFRYAVGPIVTCRSDGDLSPIQYRLDSHRLSELLKDGRLVDASAYAKPVQRGPDQPICMGGVNFPHIAPDGKLYICQNYPEPMGDLREQSFREIWESSLLRQKFISTRWRDLPVCSSCELSWVCKRCPASAQMENGDFHGPSRADCLLAEAKSVAVGHPGKRPPGADS